MEICNFNLIVFRTIFIKLHNFSEQIHYIYIYILSWNTDYIAYYDLVYRLGYIYAYYVEQMY